MMWTEKLLREQGYVLRQTRMGKCYERETIYQDVSLTVQGGIPVLVFACFQEQQDWMNMVFSTRLGGVSEGYLAEMNLGWNRGDRAETVKKNYRLLCNGLGIAVERLVFSDQVHETRVEYVTEQDCAGPAIEKKRMGVDGLYTDREDVILATSYADCVPLFFADPIHKVVASAHSGWRGTVGQIGFRTVEQMQKRFGCRPEDMIALIGPSICQDCYEVGGEVAEQLKTAYCRTELPDIIAPGVTEGKYQLDLQAACYYTMKKAGILPEHIQVSRICTCCQNDLLFSHRASQGKRGNLNGLIWKHAAPAVPESGWLRP